MDLTRSVAILYLCGFLALFLFSRPLLQLLRRQWQIGGAKLLSIASRQQPVHQQVACEHAIVPGVVAACSSCKKIRDDDGAWYTWEEYLSRRGAQISHGVCNECGEKLYPWFRGKKKAV